MVVKCSHCGGKMRVDESKLPPTEKIKIRCPHCSEIQVIDNPYPRQTKQSAGELEQSGEGQSKAPWDIAGRIKSTSNFKDSGNLHESELPGDAFQNFRFPAEEQAIPKSNKSKNKRTKFILWLIVSIVIIGFFALLVNIVLHGPHSRKIFENPESKQQISPQTGNQDLKTKRDLGR